jgi:hypothetical protein
VAGGQRGLVSRRQLEQAGLETNAIDRRAANGTLHRLHRGVYVVGHEALAPLARETAALLACGEGAAISHLSAAAIWAMVPPEAAGGDVHVTVVGRRPRTRAGVRVHAAGQLDVRRRHGIALTSPAQTLLDLAADRSPHLEQAFVEAHGQRLLRSRELDEFIKRAKARAGIAAPHGLIDAYASGYTRSRAERAMRKPGPGGRVAPAGGQPSAAPLHGRLRVAGRAADRRGRRLRLARPPPVENDRRRDAAHVAAGYRVIRVTWHQLIETPLAVVATIAGALAA